MKRLWAGALAAAGLLAAGCYEGRAPEEGNLSWVSPDPSLQPRQPRERSGMGGAGEAGQGSGLYKEDDAFFDSNTVGAGQPYESTSATKQTEPAPGDQRGDPAKDIGETKQD